MEERAAPSGRLRSFGSVTSPGTVAKYPSGDRDTVSRERSLRVAKTDGRRDYVPLASRWRCGSGMTPPHSTQRTLPVLCSSSETQSEIRRLCIQAQGGLIGNGCGACPDSSRFTVHLRDGTYVLLTDLRYRSSPISVMQDTTYGNVGGPPADTECGPNGSNYMSS